MSKVITFSRFFPKYHPRAGQQTFFVEKIYSAIGVGGEYLHIPLPDVDNFMYNHDENYFEPKLHTIRAGNRFKVGEKFSPRVWSGKPYASKQIIFAPDIEIKQIYDIEILNQNIFLNGSYFGYYKRGYYNDDVTTLSNNDGLCLSDFENWFGSKPFKGQIICWADVSY